MKLILCFCLALPGAALAGDYSAAMLRDDCTHYILAMSNQPSDTASRTRCVAYVTGMLDGINMALQINATDQSGYDRLRLWCPPQGVTYDQAIRIFHKTVTDFPEQAHLKADMAFYAVMVATYPCPKGKTRK